MTDQSPAPAAPSASQAPSASPAPAPTPASASSPPMFAVGLLSAAAMATVGAVAGGMVGLSQSPVVSDALPLVFGLIAGGGGFALATMDITSATRRAQLRAASLGVLAFAAAFAAAALWGIDTRTERRLAAISDLTPAAQAAFAARGAHEQAGVWLARARLAELGAAREEQAMTLSRALTQPPPPETENRCAAMQPHLDRLIVSLSADPLRPSQSDEEETERQNIAALAIELTGVQPLVAICAETGLTALSQTLSASVSEALSRAVTARGSLSAEDSPYTALAMFPGAPEALANLLAAAANGGAAAVGGLPPLNEDWTVSEAFQGLVAARGRSLASVD